MIEENVRSILGDGETCFVCESEIPRGSPAIEVAFNVSLLGITSKRMVERMHLGCAKRLRIVLDMRIRQADKNWGQP